MVCKKKWDCSHHLSSGTGNSVRIFANENYLPIRDRHHLSRLQCALYRYHILHKDGVAVSVRHIFHSLLYLEQPMHHVNDVFWFWNENVFFWVRPFMYPPYKIMLKLWITLKPKSINYSLAFYFFIVIVLQWTGKYKKSCRNVKLFIIYPRQRQNRT